MNIEIINGVPLYLNRPRMAADFLVEKFGFAIHAHPVSKNPDRVLICDNYGNFYEIFSNTLKSTISRNDFNLVINTTDCLQDFYRMITKGISVLSKPHYVADGLAFEISDHYDNKYTFLEKRDYTN
jgi:hypothetical protein